MIRRSKSLLLAALTLGTAVYLSAGAERAPGDDSRDPSAMRLKHVRVAAVETARDQRELRFSGTTRAATRARLAFATSGRLVARPVEVGDRVRRGQLLAQLTDREVHNVVATARASLAELAARRAQSERDHARAEQLAAAKAATGEELERTAAAVDALAAAEQAAAARLEEAQRQLEETSLRAPFDGTVTDVHFEPGEYARAGMPVITLSGDGEIEVEVEVPESVVPHVAVGDQVDLVLPALSWDSFGAADSGRTVAGRVKSVGRTTDGAGRLFPVVATFEAGGAGEPAAGVPAGATVELVLRLTSDQALALPIEAVVNPGGRRPAVFRVAGGAGGERRVEKVAVEVGSLLSVPGGAVRVVVRGDLAAGDLVVTGGQRGLLDGETVEVEDAEAGR
jgi:RND family efflux transporter MFP subunit